MPLLRSLGLCGWACYRHGAPPELLSPGAIHYIKGARNRVSFAPKRGQNQIMKTSHKYVLKSSLLVAAMLGFSAVARAQGQDIESMPPVVVKTIPESGMKDVAPEIGRAHV